MNRRSIKFLIMGICLAVIAAGLISAFACAPPQANVTRTRDTISVVMDDNYPPYVFRDEEGNLQGVLIDEWALWSEKTGITAEIHAMNWADALAGMRSGHYDVIDTVFFNDERDGWLDFAAPYATIDVPIFHNNKIGGLRMQLRCAVFSSRSRRGTAAFLFCAARA